MFSLSPEKRVRATSFADPGQRRTRKLLVVPGNASNMMNRSQAKRKIIFVEMNTKNRSTSDHSNFRRSTKNILTIFFRQKTTIDVI